jgi:hypothetical protein
MPNNSHARRGKERKKQSKRKETDSPLLHKKDTASVDKAGLDSVAHPLSLSGQDRAIMDTSSSSLSLAGDKDANQLYVGGPAQKDEPPVRVNPYSLSLTNEEKKAVFDATKLANPNADFWTFNDALGVAVWKADNQKRGIKSGGSLGSVDISLSSETDKGDSGEDSDSSEDGMQTIRDDLLRQRQVSPPHPLRQIDSWQAS